jgi:hypothetical protein
MLVQELAGQVGITQRGKTAGYSLQQVRAIMDGVDAMVGQFCSLLALKTAATQRANLEFLSSNAFQDALEEMKLYTLNDEEGAARWPCLPAAPVLLRCYPRASTWRA